MRKLFFFLAFIALLISLSCNRAAIIKKDTVNPVIGDISFVVKFGHQPDATTNESLRIQTHLEYVEKLLQQKDVSQLAPALKQKRKQLLQLLHQYAAAGIYPRNYDYANSHKPCFIDRKARICAVGYLVEQTAGRQAAEQINSRHQYDELLAMNDEMVDGWIAGSGLTKQECAMIQPAYGGTGGGGLYVPAEKSYNNITPAYGISSAVFSGINLSANTLNGIQISRGTSNKTVGILGLITGTGQTVLGIAGFPKNTLSQYNENITNESKKTLSIINIGLGTSTMILSAWNLITNKKPKEKKVTWNVNGYQTGDNNLGVAFTLKAKL